MAQPIVVAGATAESGAAVGPVDHGARSYSQMEDDVKTVPNFTKPLGIARRLIGSARTAG
jgi:hypothetical protein